MDAALLARVPLFQNLPASELARLAASLQVTTIPASTVLFREGEVGDHFDIIIDGEVEVIKALDTSDERLIGRRGAGQFLGDLSFLSLNKHRTASVRTVQPTRLWQITHTEFDQLLHRNPSMAYEMVNVLATRLTAAHDTALHDLHEKNRQLQAAYESLKAAQAQVVEKEKLERELQVAYEIQLSILPQSLPVHPAYEFGAVIVPARMVGGDFYDVFPLDEAGQQLGITIGDVSDKGVPSAIFMAQTHALLYAEAKQGRPPREVLQRLNQHLLQMNASGLFVTVLYGVLDTQTGEFKYARGGHEIPILAGRNRVGKIPAGRGNPLGVLDDPLIDEQTLNFEPGDLLLLFTDGMLDSHNEADEAFGFQRLLAAVQAAKNWRAQEVCDSLLTAAKAFQVGVPQFDDLTLVAIRCQ